MWVFCFCIKMDFHFDSFSQKSTEARRNVWPTPNRQSEHSWKSKLQEWSSCLCHLVMRTIFYDPIIIHGIVVGHQRVRRNIQGMWAFEYKNWYWNPKFWVSTSQDNLNDFNYVIETSSQWPLCGWASSSPPLFCVFPAGGWALWPMRTNTDLRLSLLISLLFSDSSAQGVCRGIFIRSVTWRLSLIWCRYTLLTNCMYICRLLEAWALFPWLSLDACSFPYFV